MAAAMTPYTPTTQPRWQKALTAALTGAGLAGLAAGGYAIWAAVLPGQPACGFLRQMALLLVVLPGAFLSAMALAGLACLWAGWRRRRPGGTFVWGMGLALVAFASPFLMAMGFLMAQHRYGVAKAQREYAAARRMTDAELKRRARQPDGAAARDELRLRRELLELAATAKDPRVLSELARHNDPRAVRLLCEIAGDESADAAYRLAAVEALGQAGDPAAIPSLRQLLADHPAGPLAEAARAAIARLQGHRRDHDGG